MSDTRLISGTFVQLDHWSNGEGTRFHEELHRFDCDDWAQLELSAPFVDKQIIYLYTELMRNPVRKHKAGGERSELLFGEDVRSRQYIGDDKALRERACLDEYHHKCQEGNF